MKRLIPLLLFCAAACAGSGGSATESRENDTDTMDTSLQDTTAAERPDSLPLIILDSHADTPLDFDRGETLATTNPKIQVTLPNMRQGGVGAQYLACWVKQGPLTPKGRRMARQRVDHLIDLCYREAEACDSASAIARSAADVRRIHDEGRIALLLGVENGYAIGRDLDAIDSLQRRGVTYITLCHTANNDICDSSSDKTGPRWGGLSAFGRDVVHRMDSLGMLIDLSHASEQTFWDVIELSERPVVCTHSGASAVYGHDRNLTDEQMRALAAKGGVVQVCAVDMFLRRDKANATIDDFMAHLLHAIEVAGVDHVGVGTDFDGGGGVAGFNSSADFPAVVERLRQAGYSGQDIAKIMGANFLRLIDYDK